MRIILVLAAIATLVAGAAPTTSVKQTATKTLLAQRNTIICTMFMEHPNLTSRELLAEVQPVLAAAGYEPIGFAGFGKVLRGFKAKMDPSGVSNSKPSHDPEHIAYLRNLFAHDPNQTPSAVVAKFKKAFGPDALSRKRINGWWLKARRRSRSTAHHVPTVTAARDLSVLVAEQMTPTHT